MENKIKVEEKLTKEERNILEKNLKICFDVIVKSTGAKSFDIENKEKFLEEFSPWHQEKGPELIQKFVDNVNNDNSTDDFSWLDILDDDKQWNKLDEETKKEIKDKSKYVNMRYQIPTHFHGDINNAVIFHCMENPRGYLGSYRDNQIDGGLGETDLNGYYDKIYKLLTEDNSKRKTIKKIKSVLKNSSKSKPIQEIIQERYQLEENANNDISKDQIKNIIYSNHESALGREIEHMYKVDENKEFCNFDFESEKRKTELLKDYYYLKEYYSQLIQTNQKLDFKKLKNEKEAVKEIADKICNVEIYPFSCAQPNLGKNGIGREILLKSDLSRLGAYIVLRRIYRYLNDKTDKPVIVLRKYSAWKELFIEILKEVEKEEKQKDKIFEHEKVLKLLEKGFFYCQTGSRGGGITSGNVISVANYKEYKDSTLTKIELNEKYLKMKDDAFKEISSLLPRIEVDKKETKIGK